eukprot:6556358-Prymnesium_polylepis.1
MDACAGGAQRARAERTRAAPSEQRLFREEGHTNAAALAFGQPARARFPHALRVCTRLVRGKRA